MGEPVVARTPRSALARAIVLRAGLLAALAIAPAGCGTAHDAAGTGAPTGTTTPSAPVACPAGPLVSLGSADVDGNGKADGVDYSASAGKSCPSQLRIQVGSARVAVPFDAALPVAGKDLRAIRIAGHRGDLLLVVQHSARGGFAMSLSAWAGASMRSVDLGVGFTATDAPTRYVSAACTSGGFILTEAELHGSSMGTSVWDVYRTTYSVTGDSFGVTPRTKIAGALAEQQLRVTYPDVVRDRLFENCASGH